MSAAPDAVGLGSRGAILLAGGRATRVGGEAKPLFDVGGRSLLQRAVDAAVAAGADPITIVAPPLPVDGHGRPLTFVREDPPFAGPAAAVVAALASWENHPDWTLLLACDLPAAEAAAHRLLRDAPLLPADTDGVCLADPSSRPQWLTGLYRTAPLRRAAAALPGGGADAPVRALMTDLSIAVFPAPEDDTADVDTWEDLDLARRRWGGAEEEQA